MSVRLGGKKEETAAEQVEQVAEREIAIKNLPLQQALLHTVWEEFASRQDGFVQQTLMLANPEVKGESVIIINLENSFQAEKVNDVKPEMMPYLRSKLQNEDITLEVKISEALESSKAFTPKEKLELLMKDNPSLVKLVNVLGLEME